MNAELVGDITRRTLTGLDQTLHTPGLTAVTRDLLRLHQTQVQATLHTTGVTP